MRNLCVIMMLALLAACGGGGDDDLALDDKASPNPPACASKPELCS